MPRRYQKVQELVPEIKRMLENGTSQWEVEERPGLEGDRQIHDLLKRERKKAKQVLLKQKGRKTARTLQEYKYENQRLKMENGLLRNFITLMGRKRSRSSSSGHVSGLGHVCNHWGIQEWLLWLCEANEPAREGRWLLCFGNSRNIAFKPTATAGCICG